MMVSGPNVALMSQAAAGGGGASTYEGLVATHLRIPDTQQSVTFINAMCRTGLKATEALTSIKLAWVNWSIATGNEGGSGTTMTITTAAVEYPIGSGRQQVLFSGVGSSSAAASDTTIFSDYLTLNQTIPSGSIFRVWFYVTMGAAGVLKRNAGADTATYGDVANLGTAGSPATNTVLAGAAPTTNISAGYVPVAACIANTVNPSVIVVGDSIAWAGIGAGGSDIPENINGRIGIIAHSFPTTLPFLNLASSGAQATNTLANSAGRQQLYPYCSTMFDETGINDARNSVAAATIASAKTAIAAAFPARVRKYCTTLLSTQTSSTDGFITTGNQTPDPTTSHRTSRDGLNALIRAGLSGFTGYLDLESTLITAPGSDIWKLLTVTTPRTITDAAITSGQITLTSATANFTSNDVGTAIVVVGAGIAGANLTCYIAAVTNSTTITTQIAASTTVSGAATAYIGGATFDGLHPTPAGYDVVAASGLISSSLWT